MLHYRPNLKRQDFIKKRPQFLWFDILNEEKVGGWEHIQNISHRIYQNKSNLSNQINKLQNLKRSFSKKCELACDDMFCMCSKKACAGCRRWFGCENEEIVVRILEIMWFANRLPSLHTPLSWQYFNQLSYFKFRSKRRRHLIFAFSEFGFEKCRMSSIIKTFIAREIPQKNRLY